MGESQLDRLHRMVEPCSRTAVMAVQALRDVNERGHLLGGGAGFVIIGVALIALAPGKQPVERVSAAGA